MDRQTRRIAGLILGSILLFTEPLARAMSLRGNPIGCKASGSASRMEKISLEGRVLLDQALLSAAPSDASAEVSAAIEMQVSHLMGFLKNTHADGLNAALSSYRGNLAILSREKVRYGISQDIDSFLPTDRGMPTNRYIQRALQRGRTQADDPALLVRYRQELLVADCSSGAWLSKQKPILPLDPYLTFWIEPKSARKPRVLGPFSLKQAPSCLSPEIVYFGNPDSSWFFWSPVDAKEDGRGDILHCELRDSAKVFTPVIQTLETLRPSPPLARDFFAAKNSLEFAVAFGVISQDESLAHLDFKELRRSISESSQACAISKTVPQCMTVWSKTLERPVGAKPLEPGIFNFLRFLKYLHAIVGVKTMHLLPSSNESEIALEIQGQFLDSGFPLRITAYFGRTNLDYGPRASATYIRFLHRALSRADSVAYLGHSGLGQNLRIENLERLFREERLPPVQRTRPLWLGVYNCEGFSYYGFDEIPLFKSRPVKLLLTQSSGPDASAMLVLAQLQSVNRAIAGNSVSFKDVYDRYISDSSFQTELWIEDQPMSRPE